MSSLPTTPINLTDDVFGIHTPRSAQITPNRSPTQGAANSEISPSNSPPGDSTPNTWVTAHSSPSPSQIISRLRLSYIHGGQALPSGSSEGRSRSHSRTRAGYSPDRFIPSSASIHNFRMGSPSHLLSSEERLLRRSTRSSSRGRSLSPERNSAPSTPTNNNRNRDTSPVRHRAAQLNRRISAGAVGVFGIGVGAAPRREEPRERGREVTVNIFGDKESPEAEMERHERRLSAALGVDRSARVFSFVKDGECNRRARAGSKRGGVLGSPGSENASDLLWDEVMETGRISTSQNSLKKAHKRTVPTTPFRVLDAPGLRDDYYCSLIAYSPHTHSLAVGLHSDVYSWTESGGARPFEAWSSSHVTSLAFSSRAGGNNILAIGRIDGSLTLWNPSEAAPRIEQPHTAGVACLAWKPVLSYRPSTDVLTNSSRKRGDRAKSLHMVETEELLVGDEIGNVYYYSVEWNGPREDRPHAPLDATIRLLRRIVLHTQQICGLAWSSEGDQFCTGGNDNVACLFEANDVLNRRRGANDEPEDRPLEGGEKYRWPHGAAVKAIAFCPWQRSLLATGGGSNDRCIHFFHTFSGATLATINVSAQVTSLLWSSSHREIAATFGYANPDHPIRIAVFSWPECKQVVQIPWQEDMRALYAVAYPGGPNDTSLSKTRIEEDDIPEEEVLREDIAGPGTAAVGTSSRGGRIGTPSRVGRRPERRTGEGCIVVAASDETVRFHEVWSETRRGVLGWRGVLGGSDILEGLEGIEKDGGEMIR
ncbi:hypothetical protein RUND412_004629 [Rhizina undulata]